MATTQQHEYITFILNISIAVLGLFLSKLLLTLVQAARPEPLAVFLADATVMKFRASKVKGIGTITINNNKNQQIGQVKTSK